MAVIRVTTATQFDIVALLEQAGAIRPPHGREKWTCPSCQHPALSVNPDKAVFRCFYVGCEFHGGLGTLRSRLGLGREWLPRDEYFRLRGEHQKEHETTRVKVEQRAAAARRLAQFILDKSAPAPENHSYLVRKRVKPHGLRLARENLVIPVRDVDGILHSLQFISPSGDKRFLSGGRIAGCCYILGLLNERLYLAEGFATGGTVFEATGEAVAVCFFAGNLKHVAEAVRRKCPRAELIICADNDRKTPGNPGLSAAKAVARQLMGRAVWPVFEDDADGSDFNDLAQQIGIAGVREELRKVASREMH